MESENISYFDCEDCEVSVPSIDGIKKRKSELFQEYQESNILFKDPDFPLVDSITFSKGKNIDIHWQRPKDILAKKQSFTKSFTSFLHSAKQPIFYEDLADGDKDQVRVNIGELGNCWFHIAVVQLSKNRRMLDRVALLDENGFTKEKQYCGAFYFRFWRFGEWVDVEIDDQLPTDKHTGELISMRSKNKDEFWSALLEKAYIKFRINSSNVYDIWKGYANLENGTVTDAYHNLTGGIAEQFYIQEKRKADLFPLMKNFQKRNCLMACVTKAIENEDEIKTFVEETGFIPGHSYEIIGAEAEDETCLVALVDSKKEIKKGDGFLYLGLVYDTSMKAVKSVTDTLTSVILSSNPELKEYAHILTYEKWKEIFDVLEVIHVCTKKFGDGSLEEIPCNLRATILHGRWNPSGGSFMESLEKPGNFELNPQFIFECNSESRTSKVIIALLASDFRKDCQCEKNQCNCRLIGFDLCKIGDPESQTYPLPWTYFAENFDNFYYSTFYSQYHEVCRRFQLESGTYCLIPSTFTARNNENGTFLIRILRGEGADITIKETLPGSITEDSSIDTRTLTDLMRKNENEIPQESMALESVLQEFFGSNADTDNKLDESKIVNFLETQFFQRHQINGDEVMQNYQDFGEQNYSNYLDYHGFRKVYEICTALLYAYYLEKENIVGPRFISYLKYRVHLLIQNLEDKPKIIDFFEKQFSNDCEEVIQIKIVKKTEGPSDDANEENEDTEEAAYDTD